jgi:dTDP-glucose 4,6-dehydratase
VRWGYRGRASCLQLLQLLGWLDRSPKELRDAMDIFAGDVRRPERHAHGVKGCDTVYHLAGAHAIPFSYHSPDAYVDTTSRAR